MNANRFFQSIVVGAGVAMFLLLFLDATNTPAMGPGFGGYDYALKTSGEGSPIILARKVGGGLGGSGEGSPALPGGITGKGGTSDEADTSGRSMRSFPGSTGGSPSGSVGSPVQSDRPPTKVETGGGTNMGGGCNCNTVTVGLFQRTTCCCPDGAGMHCYSYVLPGVNVPVPK